MKTCGIICQCKSNYRRLPHTCIHCRQSGFHNRSTLARKFIGAIHHQKISLPSYDVVFGWRVDAFLNFTTERATSGEIDTRREAKEIKRENVTREKSARKGKQNPAKSHQKFHFVITRKASGIIDLFRSDSLFFLSNIKENI